MRTRLQRGRQGSGVILGVVVGLLLGVTIQARTASPRPMIVADTVRTRTLEVTGADGQVYATLRTLSDGSPQLEMRGHDQKPRASLTVTPDGRSVLDLCDKNGKSRLVSQIGTDDTPALMLLDDKTNARADFRIETEGMPSIHLQGPVGQHVLLYTGKYGQAALDLRTANQNKRVSLNVHEGEGSPNLFLAGEDPLTNANLTVWKDRMPSLSLSFHNGERALYLGDDQTNKPRTHLKSGDVRKEYGLP